MIKCTISPIVANLKICRFKISVVKNKFNILVSNNSINVICYHPFTRLTTQTTNTIVNAKETSLKIFKPKTSKLKAPFIKSIGA